jgi:hypothetical protein
MAFETGFAMDPSSIKYGLGVICEVGHDPWRRLRNCRSPHPRLPPELCQRKTSLLCKP